ncbi:hypothetical protein [Aminobacter ciceronei]|uniref:Uncharacterized protein n=1 Tax=Aminobacter ciceronei TaxID=150723 RepID=A0ABR6C7Z7_9HYPH|nr:hypothetical protein [Aminobacter ciceronei]MBA8907370.1 hypothetical protein [Aminobacter ciceronei]MBA9021143.1 hypothetical protein [Aminobacter ciceronei]
MGDEFIAESLDSPLAKNFLMILSEGKKYQESSERCEDNQQEGCVEMKLLPNIVAGLAVVIGIVWILQGAGLLGGSFMTGRTEWFWIGIVTALAGCVAFLWLRRPGR